MDRFLANTERKSKGFTLLEMLVAVVVVSLVMLTSYKAGSSAQQASSRLKAKSFLLTIQAMQGRMWLEKGTYASLKQLGVTPPEGVTLIDYSDETKRDSSFNFSVTLSSLPHASHCRTLVLTQDALLPVECW